MADPKDQPRHGHDTHGKDDPARTRPFTFNEPRPQAEIVAEAYDHEDPTPTQEENDKAKLDAIHIPDGAGDPQSAEAKRKKELEANKQPGQGYQTRAATPKAE
jgi:hypothetical protein